MMVIDQAKKVLQIEVDALNKLIKSIDDSIEKAVCLMGECKGRIIVTGMGKSGLVGRKIAATLSSTGTPAFFLHPAEGTHGDLGMVMHNDVILAISYSGETEEINNILPLIKRMGIPLIALTGKPNSTLAKYSNIVLNIHVPKEACPFNLAPTSSTTVTMALGDALAVCLLKLKGFKKEDFAELHPRGIIGKKLLYRVEDVMRKGKENPFIDESKTIKEALLVMTSSRLGAVSVVDKQGKLVGYFTDGDLRRHLQVNEDILDKEISEFMTRKPTTITQDKLATEAVKILQDNKFDNIPVVDNKMRPIGIIDERDLLKEGIV